MTRTRLIVAAVVALVLAVGAEIPQTVVKGICGVALCVVLAIVLAAIVSGVSALAPVQRAAAASVGTLAVLMVVGFVLSVTHIGIRPDSAAPAILVVIWIACLFLWPRVPDRRSETAVRGRSRPWLLLVPGLVILAGAVVLSVVSYLHWQSNFHFATLAAKFQGSRSMLISVTNHEGHADRYRVVATAGTVLLDRTLSVDDGEQRTLLLASPPADSIVVRLYEGAESRPVHTLTVNRATGTGNR